MAKFTWRLLSLPVYVICCIPCFLMICLGGSAAGVKWLFTGRGSPDEFEDAIEWVMQPVDYVWKKAGII